MDNNHSELQRRINSVGQISQQQREELNRPLSESELFRLRGQNDTLQKEVTSLTGKNKQLETSLGEANSHNQVLWDAKGQLKKQLDEQNAKLTSLLTKVRALETELESEKCALKEMKSSLEVSVKASEKLVADLKNEKERIMLDSQNREKEEREREQKEKKALHDMHDASLRTQAEGHKNATDALGSQTAQFLQFMTTQHSEQQATTHMALQGLMNSKT